VDYGSIRVDEKYVGHSMSVRHVDISKDGKKLVTGCADHSLRIWDYENATTEKMLCGHKDMVTGGFFLNPNTVVSSSWDMTIKVWSV